MLRLQEKDELKQQLMAMDPAMAEEVFGANEVEQIGLDDAEALKRAMKAKQRGFGVGDVVVYREDILCQILAEMEEHIQISWPLHKAVYQRAVIWCKADCVRKWEKPSPSDLKSEKKTAQKMDSKMRRKENESTKRLFGGRRLFGGKRSADFVKEHDVDGNGADGDGVGVNVDGNGNGKRKKQRFQFERAWREMVVHQFSAKRAIDDVAAPKTDQIALNVVADGDDDDDDEKVGVDGNENGSGVHCELMSIGESVLGSTMRQKLEKEGDGRYEAVGVYAVDNDSVQRLYEQRKRMILRFSLNDDAEKLNERKLWYSASRENVTKILRHGFLRKMGTHDRLGFGHKFYANSS